MCIRDRTERGPASGGARRRTLAHAPSLLSARATSARHGAKPCALGCRKAFGPLTCTSIAHTRNPKGPRPKGTHGGPGVARCGTRRSTPRHLAVHRGFSTRCPRVLPNRPRTISLLPPSPSNRGHLSASTPSPSGLAPVYKSSLRRVSTDTDTDVRSTVLRSTVVTWCARSPPPHTAPTP